MPTQARTYISCVIALGAAAIAAAALNLQSPDPARFAVLLLLALISSGLKVRVPGMTGTMSLSFVPILLSTALVSLPETVLLAMVPPVIQTLLRAKRKPRLVQAAFNACAVVLSAASAALIVTAITIWWGPAARPVAIAAAAAVYYTVNALLVTTVVCLMEQKSLSGVWSNCYLWTLPYFSLGSMVLLLAADTATKTQWQPSLVVLPVMLLAYHYYAMWATRQEAVQS